MILPFPCRVLEDEIEQLRDQLRETVDENGRLYKLLKERDFEIKHLKKKIEEDFILCRKVYNLYLTIALKQLSEYGEYGNYKDFLKWFYSF